MPRILMDERFERAWPDHSQAAARLVDGGYLLSTPSSGEFVAIRAPLAEVPRDIIIDATFRKVGGPPGGGYGFILRDQGASRGDGVDQTGRYVVAEVGDRGETGVWRRDDDHWTDLVPWTQSSAIHTDIDANDLTARLISDRLTFLANGIQIADVDVGLRSGRLGLFVGGDRNEVLVERFRVQALGRPSALTAASNEPADPQTRSIANVPGLSQPRPPVVQQPPANPSREDPAIAEAQRMRDLLGSLVDDVAMLLGSFSESFEGAHSLVNDSAELRKAAARLDQAANKAEDVRAEFERIQNGTADRGR
jgi:hypothetical protein